MQGRASILVTGAGGFLGREVCEQLRSDFHVVGADLVHVTPQPATEWVSIDAATTLAAAARKTEPALVIHCAFRNRKPPDWTEERYMAEALSVGAELFETLRGLGSKLVLVSSSAVYGDGGGRAVLDESTPKRPVSAYGRAKDASEDIAFAERERGLEVCTVRLFNLVGPRLQPGTFMTDWTQQAVAYLRGQTDAIYVRHRLTQRDFVDVRDAARALATLARDFRSGELFNVASEKAVDLMDVSAELERLVGRELPFVETAAQIDPTDVRSQRGSSTKLRSLTGWRAEIPWQRSLAELWADVSAGVGVPGPRAADVGR